MAWKYHEVISGVIIRFLKDHEFVIPDELLFQQHDSLLDLACMPTLHEETLVTQTILITHENKVTNSLH